MTDRQKLRDDLMHRASIGEITGKQADEEAERLGLGRFSCKPDPAIFNPMDERFWTLPMVLAWIAYRSPDEVREYWYRYCAECYHWIWRRWRNGPEGEIGEGWFLEQRRRPNFGAVTLGSAFDAAGDDVVAMPMSVTTARHQLWEALKDGALIANALDSKAKERIDIPALDWNDLVAIINHAEDDELRHSASGRTYGDVLFQVKAVRTIWPPFISESVAMPALMPPAGDGYMPLYCVAQWIATEGGKIVFNPEDELPWRAAYSALMNAATSDKLRIIGTREGLREPVPGYSFAGCRVEYPFRGVDAPLVRSGDLFLRSYPYLDDAHWHGGFDDSLVLRHERLWTKLQVSREDVHRLWPFELATDKTGAPGRPSSSHLINDELERRGSKGSLEPTLAQQAEVLAAWLKAVHPHVARPTIGTIKNSIRHRYRSLKGTE